MKHLPIVIQQFRQEIIDILQEVMVEANLTSTCLNCKRFDEQSETCEVVLPPVRPPARVIAFGCPQFDECDVEVEPATAAPRAALGNPVRETPARKPTGFDDFDDDIPF